MVGEGRDHKKDINDAFIITYMHIMYTAQYRSQQNTAYFVCICCMSICIQTTPMYTTCMRLYDQHSRRNLGYNLLESMNMLEFPEILQEAELANGM